MDNIENKNNGIKFACNEALFNLKNKAFILIIISFFGSKINAQQIDLIDKNSLIELFNSKNDDTIRVINFWATWCKPCIKELPYFSAVNKENTNPKMKFYFVSFDMKKNKEQVENYIKKNKVTGIHYLITETDFDSFINKIDTAWSGSIPYTSVMLNNKRTNHEGDFKTQNELQEFINNNIK